MPHYGLIGYPLGHSFSPVFFAEKFGREGLKDHQYSSFPIQDVSTLRQLIQRESLDGVNVTIPHKKSILPLLDECTDVVKEIESCNCIKVTDGRLMGYNTDVIGFEKAFTPMLNPFSHKALILGTGGSAMAVEYVLRKKGIESLFVSRRLERDNALLYEDLSHSIMSDYKVIINTSPVGMFPHVDDYPAIPYQYITDEHFLFDLIYNPLQTKFLQKGAEHGATIKNGEEMLKIQAEESWAIWNEV